MKSLLASFRKIFSRPGLQQARGDDPDQQRGDNHDLHEGPVAPQVEQHTRDVAAAAAVLQTLSWLHASRGFTDRRACIAFGAWMGLGVMLAIEADAKVVPPPTASA